MKSVLFLSNGHGEDDIAGKIIDRLRRMELPGVATHAWPMVGHGEAYRRRAIPRVGVPSLLPSCGFGTLSLSLFWRDLQSGWLSTQVGQARAARALRGQYALAVAIGDGVVVAAAVLAHVPFLFVGSASPHTTRRGTGPICWRMSCCAATASSPFRVTCLRPRRCSAPASGTATSGIP